MTAQPLPAQYDFALYRGDTRVWTNQFNESPPAWAPDTAYLAAAPAAPSYTALTTVTHGTDAAGLPVAYTCITSHTSASTFDTTKWVADLAALGPAIDLTGWEFLSEYRKKPDDAVPLAVDLCEIVDPTAGLLRRTLSHDEAAKLPSGKVTWDLQGTRPDGTVRTYLVNKQVLVNPDTSR